MKIIHKEYQRTVIIPFEQLREEEEGITVQWCYKDHPSVGCKVWREGQLYCTEHSVTYTTRHIKLHIVGANILIKVRR